MFFEPIFWETARLSYTPEVSREAAQEYAQQLALSLPHRR